MTNPSDRQRIVGVAAAIALVAVAAVAVARRSADPVHEAAAPQAASPVRAVVDVAPPARADLAPPASSAVEAPSPDAPPASAGQGSLAFPDGSTRPALNGVTEPLEVPWPSGRPFAPVVEQLWHNGVEWYRHADGSFTTTVVRTETVGGQQLQIPLCFTPEQAPAEVRLRR